MMDMQINPPFQWITEAIRNPKHADVGCLMPPVFEAYARIFHPAYRRVGPWPDQREVPVSWQQVATANGRVTHPAMQWGSLVGSWALDNQPGLWDRPPDNREVPVFVINALARILKRYTGAVSILYAVWDGYMEVSTAMREHAAQLEDVEILELPIRRMYVKRGSIDDAAEPFGIPGRTPDLWWPTDQEWFVATDVDLVTTYVGGNARCIEAIINDDKLEAMQVTSEQGLTWDTDTINPRPAPPS
jgi:hypothetical protein